MLVLNTFQYIRFCIIPLPKCKDLHNVLTRSKKSESSYRLLVYQFLSKENTKIASNIIISQDSYLIVCIGVSTHHQNHHPFFSAKPPLNLHTVQDPLFGQFIGYLLVFPETPIKKFPVNPNNIIIFHP